MENNKIQQEFTKEYLLKNSGCYMTENGGNIEEILKDVTEPVTLEQILNSNIPLKDKYWFVCKKLATKEQNQQIAIGVAETVLHLFENKYPEDKRPRKAIEAAKAYLTGSINLESLRQAKRDSYAAAAAAAAAAATAAAYAAAAAAAYAATYAATAAAYDADAYDADAYAATAYAATAAYDAAAATAAKEALLKHLITFCKNTQ